MVKELINRLKSKKIVITVFALVILTLLGVTYAWFSYYQETEDKVLIAGDIYMKLDSEMNMRYYRVDSKLIIILYRIPIDTP